MYAVLTLESLDKTLKCDHSKQSYTEQYVPVVLFFWNIKLVFFFANYDKKDRVDRVIFESKCSEANNFQ